MIDGIGKGGAGRIEPQRTGASQGAAAAGPVTAGRGEGRANGVGALVSELVSMGPPIDSDKVSAVRQAIAEGRYRLDPEAIAERMIASDLRA